MRSADNLENCPRPQLDMVSCLHLDMSDEPLIFLSYASQDRDRVLPFYDHLKSAGLNVWMDKHDLKGGQNWDLEIKKALQRATIIAAFLSEQSVNKRGYVQREIKIALDQAQTKLDDDIY